MKVSSYVSSFLSADDFKKPRLLYVSSVSEEKVGQDNKLVAYFTEGDSDDELKIALNKSNINRLIELFGTDETDEWTGLPVVGYRDPNVMFNNRKVGGIAFRKPKADAKVAPKAPPADFDPSQGSDTSGLGDSDIPF